MIKHELSNAFDASSFCAHTNNMLLLRLYSIFQVEGTDLFVVRAHLPVVESLGFGSELLSKTSGAATAPLLRFSHWSSLPVHTLLTCAPPLFFIFSS